MLRLPLADLVRTKRPARLPTVLTREEVALVLGSSTGTPRVIGWLLYGAGLRLLECLRFLFTRGFRSESAGYLREHLRRHVEVEQTTEHGVGEQNKPDPYLLSSDHAPLVVVLDVLSPS